MLDQLHVFAGNIPDVAEKNTRGRVKFEVATWLVEQKFTHFVTLATNDADLRSANRGVIAGLRGADRMRALAKAWDARMNRALIGPQWAKPLRRADRMFAFYALEKATTNPHWHALIRIDEGDDAMRAGKLEKLHERTSEIWCGLIASGSTVVRTITDLEGGVDYVVKEFGREVSYANFIPADAFVN